MIKAKKHLGQHFLVNRGVTEKIIREFLKLPKHFTIEIGAGTGVLTQELLKHFGKNEFVAIDVDAESIQYLKENFAEHSEQFLLEDFLHSNIVDSLLSQKKINIIGNFPYNISTQIMFKILNHKNNIEHVVGMFQKEVAQRICAPPGNKDYGIPSVMLQTYYETQYLFTVNEGSFFPPPKVKSAVIELRKKKTNPVVNETLFFDVVKTAFNQRRKTLKNSLKKFGSGINFPYADKRPEATLISHNS
ncbi:MAG: ribosomal RNA small subunit methyltransferase A [Bacteroidia bacterium]|nr:MAG: ribosomal RNA small subunit methyltransferase A [Bacteroidia bacterium]